jgi:hypothetical protein
MPLRAVVVGLLALFVGSACQGVEYSTVARGPDEAAAQQPGRRDAGRELAIQVADETASPTRRPRRQPRITPEPTDAALVATPAPEATEKPKKKVKVIRLKPRPKRGPFRMDLYRQGDFVHQATKDWCVAGSTQTMLNIIRKARPNRSTTFQRQLYVKGRRLSPNKVKLGPIGVDLVGWADLLNTAGHGPYVVEASASRHAAIKKAAIALRTTGRPVGLVVWRGAHSWVMSGFTATADPAFTRDFEVTGVYIQDVWYPSVSTIWGASRPPGSLVPMSRLGEDYLPYSRPRARYPGRDGRFMLVMPTLPKNTVTR